VTKLSLLLKVLEEETGQLSLGFERVLPDLGDNIRCGNSLIGWDYFEGQLISDEKEVERVNPFDWQKSFPQVFATEGSGGFDAVIGNPPYLGMENMESVHRDYYYGSTEKAKRYKTAEHKANLYSFFWEKAVSILKSQGFAGFITPYSWMTNSSFLELRRLLVQQSILSIVLLPLGIFKDAGIKTCTLILQKVHASDDELFKIQDIRDEPLESIPSKIGTDKSLYQIQLLSLEFQPR